MGFLKNIFGSKGTSFAGLIGVAVPLVTYFGGMFELDPKAIVAIVSLVSMALGGTLFIAKDPNAD